MWKHNSHFTFFCDFPKEPMSHHELIGYEMKNGVRTSKCDNDVNISPKSLILTVKTTVQKHIKTTEKEWLFKLIL